MNTVAKGNRIELKAKKILESEGWLVEKPIRTRWGRNDFFNVADLWAIKGEKYRLVQTSTKYLSSKSKEKKRIWAKFPYRIEYWRYHKGKFIIDTYKGGEKI